MDKEHIHVAIVSDVACPWCYIGKRRLEKALAQWQGAPVVITWHPFQLDPTLPEEGLDMQTYLSQKFGDTQQIQEMTDRLTALGAEEGIDFNFGPPMRAVRTLPLHQLMHVAGQEGFKDALKERFFKAYFTENLHLNEAEVLEGIMSHFGWEAEKTRAVLNDDTIAYSVKQEIGHYQQRGVSGVPFFIVNDTYGISGAQTPEAFLEVFAKVSNVPTIPDGKSCGTNGADC